MSDRLVVYEAGVINSNGKYSKFIESPEKKKVEDYIEIMKTSVLEGLTIVFLEKTYDLISTIPHTIK